MTFRLSVPSFFQINRPQTERLYAQALEFAGLTGQETVLDLYCGIGTISLALAQRAGQVIGAEIVPQAVEDAKANAARNGVTNARFFCGDAGEVARPPGRRGGAAPGHLRGPAPEGAGPGGAGDPGLHGAGAHRLRLLRPGHPGPGREALRGAGLPGGQGPGGGPVPPDRPRGVCCLDVKGGEVEGLQMPI